MSKISESELFQIFSANEGRNLWYKELAIWPYDRLVNLRVGVYRLRRRMKKKKIKGRIISVSGFGYRYEREEEP